MARRGCICCVCEGINQPALCATCCNVRLSEKYKLLKRAHKQRDEIKFLLEAQLVAKRQADSQRKWRAEHVERKTKLRDQLRRSRNDLLKVRAHGEEQKKKLDAQTDALASASAKLAARRRDNLGKHYPDLICTQKLSYSYCKKRRMQVRLLCKILPIRRCLVDGRETSEAGPSVRICDIELPLRENLASVPHDDLGAALGYLLQLMNLTARYMSAPQLHSSGFAASSSRVWQRGSYWDTRPAHRGEEYPLFLPRENAPAADELSYSATGGQSNLNMSFTEASRSTSREMDGGDISFRFTSSLTGHSTSQNAYRDVQEGIKLLRLSAASLNAVGYRLLALQVPADLSPFEAFAELLSLFTSKEQRPRSSRGSQQPNGRFGLSEGHISRATSCPPSMLEDVKPVSDKLDPSSSSRERKRHGGDFVDVGDLDHIDDRNRVTESLFDGWDFVEHPTLPPPPIPKI